MKGMLSVKTNNVWLCLSMVFALTMTLTACDLRCEQKSRRVLAAADSLIEADKADSALAVLDSVADCMGELSKSVRMRHVLLKAKAQNKAYVNFITDSVMLDVVDYYDSHGTANDRMQAHYLLGCAYRDLHEAPVALSCYYDALEAADTLSGDCDYITMMRIWGQIAEVYRKQLMPIEYIEANKQYSRYAKKANDVYESIRGIELQYGAYMMMNDTTKMLQIVDTVAYLYKKHGCNDALMRPAFEEICLLIDKKEYNLAKKKMDYYDNKYEVFNKDGDIVNGKAIYYYFKGDYYLGINKLDSAKLFYNKTICNGYAFDGFRGMMKVYSALGNADSAIIYLERYSELLGNVLVDNQADASINAKAMHDYTRQQCIATQKEKEATQYKTGLYICAIIILLVIVCALVLRMHNKIRWQNLKLKYILLQKELNNIKLQQDSAAAEQRYMERIRDLESQMTPEERWLVKVENAMMSPTMDKVRAFTHEHIALTPECATELMSFTAKLFPKQYDLMIKRKLSCTELQVCCLVLLNFSNADTARLVSKTPQAISNIRLRLVKKMFDVTNETSAVSFDTLLRFYEK